MAVVEEKSCLVFTDSLERATSIVEEYERQTCSRFISASISKDFGKAVVALNINNKKIYWNKCYQNETEASTPYIIVGQKLLDCHHGKDPDNAKKAKYKAEKEKKENPVSYLRVTPSKKVNCPAKIILRDVVYFIDFKIPQDTKYHRQMKGRKLKADFKMNNSGKIRRHILVNLPATNEHRNHLFGEEDGLSQRVDPKVSKKIDELLAHGVNNITDIQYHLKSFVTTQQFPGQSLPAPTNRRYFPSKKSIRGKIYQFTIQQKKLSLSDHQTFAEEQCVEEIVSKEVEVETEHNIPVHFQSDINPENAEIDINLQENLELGSPKNIETMNQLGENQVSLEVLPELETDKDLQKDSKLTDKMVTEKYLKAHVEIVSSLDEAIAVVRDYEKNTSSKFISRISPKDFGKPDVAMNLEAKKIYWDPSYCSEEAGATPYINISQKQLECQFGGKVRDDAKKVCRHVGESDDVCASPQRGRPSKKVDCPAKIVIRDLVYFTDFKIKGDTKYHREMMSKKLKGTFKEKQSLRITRHFFVHTPAISEHLNHVPGQVVSTSRKRKTIST